MSASVHDTRRRANVARHPETGWKRVADFLVFGVVLTLVVGSIAWGVRYFRHQAAVDYSSDLGLLEPLDSHEWVRSVEGSVKLQVPSDGWVRHKNGSPKDRVFLSRPQDDTHVVLIVETLGFGRKPLAATTIKDRILASMEEKATRVQILRDEALAKPIEDSDAHQLALAVTLDETDLVYQFRLHSWRSSVATLACFGAPVAPDSDASRCETLLDSFSWATPSVAIRGEN